MTITVGCPILKEGKIILIRQEEALMEKKSWDDIPSLGLELDTGNALKKSGDNRAAVRLVSQDLLEMLTDGGKVIYVKVATGKRVLSRKGVLRDINQNGMGFQMSAHGLKKNESIQVGAMLGRRGFKTNAVVRWTSNDKVGVEYINPRPDDYSFLAELYAAKKLSRI